MTKEDIRPGVILRVVTSRGIGAPRHAVATVETVDTSPSGDWLCTIRYHEQRQGKRQHLYRSHLWQADLGRFEIVTDLSTADQLPSRRGRNPFKAVTPRLQLDLPFQENDALGISLPSDL